MSEKFELQGRVFTYPENLRIHDIITFPSLDTTRRHGFVTCIINDSTVAATFNIIEVASYIFP